MDIKFLFKRFFDYLCAILSTPSDLIYLAFCQLFGLQNWFAYFSARSQKNAIAVGNFIPSAAKIGNF